MSLDEDVRVRFVLNASEDPVLHYLFSKTDAKSRAKLVRSLLRRLPIHHLGLLPEELPEHIRFLFAPPQSIEYSLPEGANAKQGQPDSIQATATGGSKRQKQTTAEVAIKSEAREEKQNSVHQSPESAGSGEFQLPSFILDHGLGILAEGATYS